jgi:hypothetical protein
VPQYPSEACLTEEVNHQQCRSNFSAIDS